MNSQEIKDLIKSAVGKEIAEKVLEARAKQTSVSALTNPAAHRPLGQQVADVRDEEYKPSGGINAAKCIRFLYGAGGNAMNAADMAERAGEKHIAKALGQSTLAGGGAWLPMEFSAEIIEVLRAKSVVRAMGASIVPMNNGSLTMPFVATGATSAYVGENSNITKSQQTAGQLQLRDHKLACLVPTSNDLLRNGGPAVDNVLRNDVVASMRAKEDITFIRSLGVSNEPKGMKGWVPSANVNTTNTTVTLATVTNSLGLCIQELEEGNVDLTSAGWLFAPRTKKYLMTVRDSNGNLVFAPEMSMAGTLMGYPFMSTSQIPINLATTSTSESEVYFAAFNSLVIAENESLMVEVFPGGTYYDNSSLVSGISQDQTVIRVLALHDFGARQRGAEISEITVVKWGA